MSARRLPHSVLAMHDPIQLPPGRPIRIIGEDEAAGHRLRDAVAALPGRHLLADAGAMRPGTVVVTTSDPAGAGDIRDADLVYDARPYLRRRGDQDAAAGLLGALLRAGTVVDDRHLLHGPEDFHKLPQGRPIHIYGTGTGGRVVRGALESAGIALAAFVDSWQDGELDGLPVIRAAAFLNGAARESTIVIASQAWADIERTLIAGGVTDAFNALPIVRRHLWDEYWARTHARAGGAA
ncbi:hypothetical protein [Azospirillum sp. sgz302134]